jgi:lipoate-protein ligase A
MHDVIHARSGTKIAGAAQKRNKHGLLFQGSLWRPAAGGRVDGERLQHDFVAGLAAALGVVAEPVPWPELNDDEVGGLTEQYASPEWLEYR